MESGVGHGALEYQGFPDFIDYGNTANVQKLTFTGLMCAQERTMGSAERSVGGKELGL